MKKKSTKRKVHNDGTESDLERLFLINWRSRYPHHLPFNNFEFHLTRKWRFDFAWPTHKIAVEIQGIGPGHCSLAGMTKDYDKLMEATKDQWKVIYLTSSHLLPENIDRVCRLIAMLLGIDVQPTTNSYVPLSQRK